MGSLLTGLVAVATLSIFLLWFFYFRYWHVGFGVVLGFNRKHKTVWIISLLDGSPAEAEGVKKYSKLLSIDGFPMEFSSEEEFYTWLKNNPHKIGKKEVWELEERGIILTTAKMYPSLIKKRIPVYCSLADLSSNTHPVICRDGILSNLKTGKLILTRSVAPQTFRNIIR